MIAFLLVIIYSAFISLGLPDALLGSGWPAMRADMLLPLSTAGLVSMIISIGTILSSLNSGWIIKRFGTGKVTFTSVLMTAVALFGFSQSDSLALMCLSAIPLGLGAGSVDAALNNFVALHFRASHMSWLHSFWGVGATASPLIMSAFLTGGRGWRGGYLTVAIIQFTLVLILFVTLPLWNKVADSGEHGSEEDRKLVSNLEALKIPGIRYALVTFFFYCSLELTTGLWGSSYLVGSKGIDPGTAARWVSLFYAGITVGRMVTGFIALKVAPVKLIRMGQLLVLFAVGLLLLPLPAWTAMPGLLLLGLGCAPIYPSMIHETPKRFGREASQTAMGLQMAFAYTGNTMMPPLLGFIAGRAGIGIFPYFLLGYALIMFVSAEKLGSLMRHRMAATGEIEEEVAGLE